MGLCHSVQNPNAPRKTPSTGQSKEKFIHNKLESLNSNNDEKDRPNTERLNRRNRF